MHRHRLALIASAAVIVGGGGTAAARGGSAPPHPAGGTGGRITWTVRGRPVRPDRADWERIRAAAGLRHLALEPHRSVRFRTFSAFLGLSELTTIHPLGPGPCATAVVYLYDNLLDLNNATQGENWNPLRRAVAKEPSIHVCAPRRPSRRGA